jgi:photosystem II stability/assembly factor-like uncharacterized protein
VRSPVSPRVACCVAILLTLALRASAQDLAFIPAPDTREPTSRTLLDITRAGERLVAVGAAGLVILSDDSGDSWRQASVPVSATLTAVDFPTASKGWAVGHAGVILHSADGGSTWTLQHDGRDTSRALLAYAMARREALEAELDELEAAEDADAALLEDVEFALEDAIFLEEDAQLAIETGPADPLLDVTFLDEARGFAAGAYGALLRTVDGGASWDLAVAAADNPDRFHYYAMHASDAGGLFLAGEAGLLFRSGDGGDSFERYEGVYEGSLFGLAEVDGVVRAFGLRGNQFIFDAATDSWAPAPGRAEFSLYGGSVLDDGRLLLLGAGGAILRRDASGETTTLLHPSRATLAAAAAAPDGRIWLVGMSGLVSFSRAVTP